MLKAPLSRLFRSSLSSLLNTRSVIMTANVSSQTSGLPTSTVQHNAKQSKFYIPLKGHDEAVLEYTVKNGIIDMYHTEVPPAYREKGLAGILAKAAFEHAVENNLTMKLTCSYLQKYYKDHPDERYKKLVVL